MLHIIYTWGCDNSSSSCTGCAWVASIFSTRVFFTLPNEAEPALNDAPRSESAAVGLRRPMTPYKSQSLAGLILDTHHFGAFLHCEAVWKAHFPAAAVCLWNGSVCSALLVLQEAAVKRPSWCSKGSCLNKHTLFYYWEKLPFGRTVCYSHLSIIFLLCLFCFINISF